MTKQVIGIGTVANDGTGDALRTAFNKANLNFTELYTGSGGLLAKSGVAVPLTGGTTETTMATVTIAANTLGANGLLFVRMMFSCTSNANNKTIKLRLGGIAGTTVYSNPITTGSPDLLEVMIMNRNATNSQIAVAAGNRGDLVMQGHSLLTTSVDTTASQDLVITGTLGTGTDTLQLEGYVVEYRA